MGQVLPSPLCLAKLTVSGISFTVCGPQLTSSPARTTVRQEMDGTGSDHQATGQVLATLHGKFAECRSSNLRAPPDMLAGTLAGPAV